MVTEIWDSAARIESRLEIAALRTPAISKPFMPTGISLRMKTGKMRSPFSSTSMVSEVSNG